jgi:hypothetical protein
MYPYRSASEANSLLAWNPGPEPPQPCMATTIAGAAGRVSGT